MHGSISSYYVSMFNKVKTSDTKIVVSISAFDLFSCPMRTHVFCKFYLTYSCICLELFLRVQSMKVHDLANYVWSLFTKEKWD
jgi:hypothetical protein